MEFTKLISKLKEKNLRITKARKDVFSLLEKSDHSLSAREVYSIVSKKDHSPTDLASVYRNLSLFEELGLAHKFQDGRYSSCYHGEEKKQHSDCQEIHIISHCRACGKSREFAKHSKEICEIEKSLGKLSSSLHSLSEIIVQGLCKDCSQET